MGNNTDNQSVYKRANKAREQNAYESIRQEQKLSRAAVVTKSFAKLHIKACEYDLPTVLASMGVAQEAVAHETAEVNAPVAEVIDLNAKRNDKLGDLSHQAYLAALEAETEAADRQANGQKAA